MKTLRVLAGLVALAVALTGCAGAETDEDKIAVVAGYMSASNAQDWDVVASYLSEDVVFDTPTGTSEGLDAWWETIEAGDTGPDRQEPVDFSVDENLVRVEAIMTFSDLQFPAILEVLVMDGKIQRLSVREP